MGRSTVGVTITIDTLLFPKVFPMLQRVFSVISLPVMGIHVGCVLMIQLNAGATITMGSLALPAECSVPYL